GEPSVIGVIRRHLDIGDHDVRAVNARLADQIARIGGGSRDLETAGLQDAHDALTHDRLVLADEYPNRCGLSHQPKLRDLHAFRPASPGVTPGGNCGDFPTPDV